MAVRYTEEQLNTVDKSLLIQMFLNQQEQLQTLTAEVCSLNEKMQLMMEQMVLANRNRFGRSLQIPLHRITDSASNGSVFPVVTEHFSASSDHAFL